MYYDLYVLLRRLYPKKYVSIYFYLSGNKEKQEKMNVYVEGEVSKDFKSIIYIYKYIKKVRKQLADKLRTDRNEKKIYSSIGCMWEEGAWTF